jgi:putative ABC transport system permease protein
MNILYLAYKQIWHQRLKVSLSLMLFMLSTSLVSLIFILQDQAQGQLEAQAKGVNMVVGAKGSPLQLVLATLYHLDQPTGNIDLRELRFLTQNPMVEKAIPISLGDSYRGFRLIGTTSDYYQHFDISLQTGNFPAATMQVVIGSRVASHLNLSIGDTFEATHGLSSTAQDENTHGHLFRVVGILAPHTHTVNNLIFTTLESYWHLHDQHHQHEPENDEQDDKHHPAQHDEHHHDEHQDKHHDESDSKQGEITALLVRYKGAAAFMLPRTVNENTPFQAAVPAQELQRLLLLTNGASWALQILGIVILVVSALSLFVSLLSSLKERLYEMAVLRSLGAGAFYIFTLICIESSLVALFGGILGIGLAHTGLALAQEWLASSKSFYFSPWELYAQEAYLLLGVWLLSLLAAFVPAWRAAQADIHHVLAKGRG